MIEVVLDCVLPNFVFASGDISLSATPLLSPLEHVLSPMFRTHGRSYSFRPAGKNIILITNENLSFSGAFLCF